MGPRLRTQGAAWPLALQESARIAPSSAGMKTKGIKTTQMRCFFCFCFYDFDGYFETNRAGYVGGKNVE